MPTLHALIIDDNPTNIDVLALLLEQEGVAHTALTSSQETLKIIDQLPHPDIVFLDLDLGNDDYYYLLRELKANDNLAGVPIVAYTVHITEIETARQAGFDGFLAKPLHTTEFPHYLQRLLSGQSIWIY